MITVKKKIVRTTTSSSVMAMILDLFVAFPSGGHYQHYNFSSPSLFAAVVERKSIELIDFLCTTAAKSEEEEKCNVDNNHQREKQDIAPNKFRVMVMALGMLVVVLAIFFITTI